MAAAKIFKIMKQMKYNKTEWDKTQKGTFSHRLHTKRSIQILIAPCEDWNFLQKKTKL